MKLGGSNPEDTLDIMKCLNGGKLGRELKGVRGLIRCMAS